MLSSLVGLVPAPVVCSHTTKRSRTTIPKRRKANAFPDYYNPRDAYAPSAAVVSAVEVIRYVGGPRVCTVRVKRAICLPRWCLQPA
eukprot:4045678-Pyramimonas_sp.AAC.1